MERWGSAEVLEIRLLGNLEVLFRGRSVAIPGGRQRVLLASIALDKGRPIAVDEIIERMWGNSRTAASRTTVRGYVKRLRRVLNDAIPGGRSFVLSGPEGYRLRADTAVVDVDEFRELTAAAASVQDPRAEAELLDASLALWRGRPLSSVDSSSLSRDVVPALEERHLLALHRRIAIGLDHGEAADHIPRLRQLLAEKPLEERFWAQLITALQRSGRGADAVRAYDRCRRILDTELGVEPGPDVRAAHRSVLGHDPPRPAPPPDPPPATTREPVRAAAPGAHRPPAPSPLWERTEDLAALDRLLTRSGDHGCLIVVDGPAGVGKTALARHWSYLRAPRFPNGLMRADLSGYAPRRPADPSAVLRAFLLGLGYRPREIPGTLDARSALLRTALSGRRTLLLLDNARSADQVRPLLPGPGNTVVVTSRNQLRGLVARNGAHRHTLAPLSVAAAAELLMLATGERGAAEQAAAQRLAQLFGGLPMALCSVAAVVSGAVPSRDGTGAAPWTTALRTAHAAMRDSLSWSLAALSPQAQELFGRLPYVPGRLVGIREAAALSGAPEERARHLLDELSRTHLLEQPEGDGYRMPHFPVPPRRWAAGPPTGRT